MKERRGEEKGMQCRLCSVVISRDESEDISVEKHTSTNDYDPTFFSFPLS